MNEVVEKFKRGRNIQLNKSPVIRKMQTAAGGPIKKPIKRLKDGYRYIPDEENGGWDRISDNSMSDVFATMEFTPKKTKVGSPITRKQSAPSKTYYSAYNPDDVVKGFNALTLGGLNNLSPTQWIRRYLDLNQLLVSQIPGSKRTMTWSGFVNNWLNGNNGLVSGKFAQEHPYWSMGINGVGDAVALGGLANANTVKLVGNIAAKHGGDAAKITIDVAKNSSKPFNLKNYKFLGDSRFYSDLNDVGYKTLMSERLSGNYPLTFAERKNYITGLKNDIQKGVDYAINEAKANLKAPLKSGKVNEYTSTDGSKSLRFDPYSPEDILPQRIHYGTLRATKEYGQTPWEGNYGAFLDENVGLFFPFRNKPNTLRTHSMFQDVGERVSTGAHETRHTIQKYFDTPLVERRYDLPGTYGRYTNRELPLDFKKKVNEFVNDALTAGEWEGSLAEMDSELTGWSAKYGFPRYSQMDPKQKALLHDLFLKRFGGTSDYKNYGEISSLLKLNPDYNTSLLYSKILDDSKIGQIILGLETLGYRKQGGKINIVKQFKEGGQIRKMQTAAGGPINYKRWDNAKITSYTIPYIKEKTIKLTNAGKATGAKLSTNLLDSLADNAYRAGLPIRKGLGIAFKESTFGNPTDDKSAWNLSSKIRELFNNKYPGTYLHINNGRTVIGQHLINYHKGDVNHEIFYKGNPDSHKSIILEAFEFYKQHPDKYNQGLKNYQQLIDERGNEAMQSPEILKWYRGWEKSKAQIFKPEPYKINANIQNTALEFVPYKKEGGKMNTLEFLKKGSGIHIKKENRGKFTDYCGGTVTDECIRRGKNSSSATIRKRATFAANARKWKHKKGGKAFVEGVNVLDSNPDAYKYVKRKYKMRSAAGGSKVDWGGVANTIGGLSNSVMNIAKTFKNQKAIDLMKKANASMLNAYKSQAINNAYNDALNSESDKSDIVNRFNAYHKATNSASQIVALKLRELDLQVAQAEQANAAAQLEAWTGAIKDLGGLAINALNKKGMTLKASNTSNDSMFSKNVNVGGTNYKAFNTPAYKSFGDWADANTFKKEGTIDSNGFMNTRLGKMDMNFNIVKLPIKTELFKLNI